MKRRRILRTASAGFLAMIALSPLVLADSPLPRPTKQTIWSASKQFFAVMEPDKQITTVYRANDGKPEKVWSMFGWFRVADLADDGDHLVVGYEGVNLLPLNYDKQQVMIYFFKRGELINHVTLDQIIVDHSKLQRTASHYSWA